MNGCKYFEWKNHTISSSRGERCAPIDELLMLPRIQAMEERLTKVEAQQERVEELEQVIKALVERLTEFQAIQQRAGELQDLHNFFMKVFLVLFMLFAVFVVCKLSGA
ncbi:hypothetical protein QJS10_CPB20g00861 [Acorus calamus]|uniref:Uncharacterized protein n=1 Tax=Acorus calamus TaxID=4465 RepID=A0AAV9CD66_ACOCL|nr:hypothetical protein QJS10_CPB20g00861 [Acorus calamus]